MPIARGLHWLYQLRIKTKKRCDAAFIYHLCQTKINQCNKPRKLTKELTEDSSGGNVCRTRHIFDSSYTASECLPWTSNACKCNQWMPSTNQLKEILQNKNKKRVCYFPKRIGIQEAIKDMFQMHKKRKIEL